LIAKDEDLVIFCFQYMLIICFVYKGFLIRNVKAMIYFLFFLFEKNFVKKWLIGIKFGRKLILEFSSKKLNSCQNINHVLSLL